MRASEIKQYDLVQTNETVMLGKYIRRKDKFARIHSTNTYNISYITQFVAGCRKSSKAVYAPANVYTPLMLSHKNLETRQPKSIKTKIS